MKRLLIGALLLSSLTLGAQAAPTPEPSKWPDRFYAQEGYYEYNPRTNSYELKPYSRDQKPPAPKKPGEKQPKNEPRK